MHYGRLQLMAKESRILSAGFFHAGREFPSYEPGPSQPKAKRGVNRKKKSYTSALRKRKAKRKAQKKARKRK